MAEVKPEPPTPGHGAHVSRLGWPAAIRITNWLEGARRAFIAPDKDIPILARSLGALFLELRDEAYEAGRQAGIEEAARLIEGHVVASGPDGNYLKPETRIGGRDVGRALYAEAIRVLAKKEKPRG